MITKGFIQFLFISLILLNCKSKTETSVGSELLSESAINKVNPDSIFLKETFQQEDTAYNEYFTELLKPIRDNFKRINSIATWTSVVKTDLEGSSEGGEAVFYYSGGALEKITTRYFGETGQSLTEYYLLNGQLSFVFEKSYEYNRPIYYDSVLMKENKNDQSFDIVRSEIDEHRSYFEKGRLLHQVNNQDCGSPFAKE